MGIRSQNIDMNSAMFTRSVMDNSVDESLKIETGYIEFQNNFLPVWRPRNQIETEKPKDVWQPVYQISLTTVPNTRTIRSLRGNVPVDGRDYELPLGELKVTSNLKRHLKEVRARPLACHGVDDIS
jgi:hypothetical protein